MTTYSVREFKSSVSQILRELDSGEEVIITRRGKPCGKLIPIENSAEEKPSLRALRGAFTELPDATYEDFLNIKALWEPRMPDSGGKEISRGG